jgi:MGT family glycosyltransferase
MNSTMESIAYGVPMVVIPQMPEQAVTARRVQELGLGVALEADEISPKMLRDAVIRVAEDPAFRERVREMQRLAREAGGYRRAAEAIIQFSRVGTLTAGQPAFLDQIEGIG